MTSSHTPDEAIAALLQAHDQHSAISHVRRLYPRLEQALHSGISYLKICEALAGAGVRMTPTTLSTYMVRIRKELAQGQGRATDAPAAPRVEATPTPNPSQGAGVDPPPENTSLASILDLSLSNEARHQAIGKYFETGSEQSRIAKILKRRKQTP